MVAYAKEIFSAQRQSKLLPRGDEPFQVLEHINDNAYKLNFLGEHNVSAIFNVTNLSFFYVGGDLRTNPFQEEGNEGMTNKWNATPIQVLVGPVTRARAKKFKETLNGLIQNIWAKMNSWRPKKDVSRVPQGSISMIQAFK